ncbi:MAG: YafY family transcriptional regulator [Desulfomonile sp.]|nr:YafY family transcriptional regulator [Desulfomonile sp.]
MRGSQLARQWKIIKLIESRKKGITGTDLANELEVPLRTVYRDLDTIQQAGFPLYTDRIGKNSYWKLLETFKKDFPVPLTTTELMALHMSRDDLLGIFEGTIFHESIESLFTKIKSILPPETLHYLDNISGRLKVHFGPAKKLSESKEIIRVLSEATAKRRRVEISYRAVSTGHETTRKVDPYQVSAMNGGFYLIGLCHLRNGIRTFAMDRIKNCVVLEEFFPYPKDFNVDDYLQSAFRVMRGKAENVTVRFLPAAAYVIRERIWHPTQEIREREDGGLEISLSVPINFEIVSWILGFGAAAEVVRPASLRKRISDELQRAAAQYREAQPVIKAYTKKVPARLS